MFNLFAKVCNTPKITIIIPATEIGALHDLGPLCVNAMKEAMFDGPEVLDKMLEDADQANQEDNPDEIPNVIDTKEVTEELNNIINDLEKHVVEKVEESNTNNEDANNNISGKSITEDVPPPEKQILTFENIYKKPASDPSNEEITMVEQMEINGNTLKSSVTLATERYVLLLVQFYYFKSAPFYNLKIMYRKHMLIKCVIEYLQCFGVL